MKVVRTIHELRELRKNHARVGLVPTMGAFHAGHEELMRQARQQCSLLVVSLFVNPTQFGPTEDFARYPRDQKRDLAIAESQAVDLLFAPDLAEMFPTNTTQVHVKNVSDNWEGALRPTHFDGVATVVLKLFNIVQPNVTFFGVKDLQQCAVVRTMITDLNLDIEFHLIETVREPDGLAMSSRNAYLSPSERIVAAKFPACLFSLQSSLIQDSRHTVQLLSDAKNFLTSSGLSVDYLDVVDPLTMKPIDQPFPGSRIVAAVRLGSVRLLDNLPLS